MHVDDLFASQLGLATRAQLRAAGVSDAAISWRTTRQWRVVLPGVILDNNGSLRPHQRIMAAQLYAGPFAQVTGQAACGLHGLRPGKAPTGVHVLVPATCRDRRVAWAHVARTQTLEDPLFQVGPIRLTPPARSVIDWARALRSERDTRSLTIESVQRRLTTLDELVHELERGPRRGSALVRKALVDVAAGAWSDPESDLRRTLAGIGLPEPMMNPELSLPDGRPLISPDCWFDEVALAVMVHSKEHHSREDDFASTIDADSCLTTSGIVVVGVVPRMVRTAPGEVVARVLAAHRVAAARPRPDIVVRPRSLFVR